MTSSMFVKRQPGGPAPATSGQALALIPLAVTALLALLVLPHPVAPDEVPSPTIDDRALARTMAEDEARVDRARKAPLSAEARSVGSAIRAFNVAQATGADATDLGHARDDINAARRVAITTGKIDDLLDLRAVQMVEFLAQVRRFEATGVASHQLEELGGTFVQRMQTIGWCVDHRVLMSDAVQRVAFKLTWNKLLYLDSEPEFAVTLDETRALYAFYFTHAHPSEAQRPLLGALRAGAHDPISARHADETEHAAVAAWLQPKVAELGHVDPTYPEALARGVVRYLHQDYAGAASIYEAWLEEHPGGPWTLRVQNYLRASVLAEQDRFP